MTHYSNMVKALAAAGVETWNPGMIGESFTDDMPDGIRRNVAAQIALPGTAFFFDADGRYLGMEHGGELRWFSPPVKSTTHP